MCDMTFSSALLSDSADHYKVGVDEFTTNLSNLSMLEYDGTADVLFRIRRIGMLNAPRPADDDFMPDELLRDACTFKIDRPYLTLSEILARCSNIAQALRSYVASEGLDNGAAAGAIWRYPFAANAAHNALVLRDFVRINMSANGEIQFTGTRYFWANFVIQVPLEKYRSAFLGNAALEYISVHPVEGTLHTPYTAAAPPMTIQFAPLVLTANLSHLVEQARTFVGSVNILHSLDRRVSLEIGTSLPLRNSPMIDHGQEAPDFVLGRYMMHQPYDLLSNNEGEVDTIICKSIGAHVMQGPKDRVVFHHLGPQQKIQILRLRLWARVRSYDTSTKSWGMKTIVCPVKDLDYWHIRLHFVPK